MSGQQKLDGTVAWFNDAKGFGYVTCAQDLLVFVHYSAIRDTRRRRRTLTAGQPIRVVLEEDSGHAHVRRAKDVFVSGKSYAKRQEK